MKVGIAVFPGSNCDRDIFHVLNKVVGIKADFIWHTKDNLQGFDALIIPGGFAFGDRLRAGVIAAHSPIMKAVCKMAEENLPILGICNGFQILVESGLLPGALIMNSVQRFVCRWTQVQVNRTETPFTSAFSLGENFQIPVAHGEGRYVVEQSTLRELKKKNQIVLRYSSDDPNGSTDLIAAVCNQEGNVVGMMPHPERSSERIIVKYGSTDAISIFKSLQRYLKPEAFA